jgi:hypothetical protein
MPIQRKCVSDRTLRLADSKQENVYSNKSPIGAINQPFS